jgi:hypothetical protein
LTLTGTSPFAGTITTQNALQIAAGGSINGSVTVQGGASLTLDNSVIAPASRLGDNATLSLQGPFTLLGNSAAPVREIIGTLATGGLLKPSVWRPSPLRRRAAFQRFSMLEPITPWAVLRGFVAKTWPVARMAPLRG